MNNDLQRADFWKRISAFLFDFIIIGIVIVGVAWALSAALRFDDFKNHLDACDKAYEEEFGIDFDITAEEFEKLTDEERQKYDEASKKLMTDDVRYYYYSMTVNLMLIIVIISVLVGHLLIELIVPLILGNGQTLGKKIFGIAVMRSDGVKVTAFQMFVRAILGKCTVETLIPVLVVIMIISNVTGVLGLVVLFALVLAQCILLIVTKARTPIHDLMAVTVTVDIASQRIFDTAEDLLEYKKKRQAEIAAKSDY
nr:hypothetical protein [Oscillospiraceae bacterium]